MKSPFLGSFFISWLVCNWDTLSYFFRSKENVETIITTIKNEYQKGYSHWLIPLLFALFYVLVLPHIYYVFDRLTSWAKNERKKTAINLLNNEFVSKKELARNQAAYEFEKSNYNSIKEAQDQNMKLLMELEELKKKNTLDNTNSNKEIERLKQELSINKGRFQEFKDSTIDNIYLNSWVPQYEQDYRKTFKQSAIFTKFRILVRNIESGFKQIQYLSKNDIAELESFDIINFNESKTSISHSWTNRGLAFLTLFTLEMDKDKSSNEKTNQGSNPYWS